MPAECDRAAALPVARDAARATGVRGCLRALFGPGLPGKPYGAGAAAWLVGRKWSSNGSGRLVWMGAPYNLNLPASVSDVMLAQVVQVIGLGLGHLFYNAPDKPEPTQSEAGEDWRGAIREVERNVRFITDPGRPADVALQVRAVALGEVEDFERDSDRRASPGGHPNGAAGKSKLGGMCSGGCVR